MFQQFRSPYTETLNTTLRRVVDSFAGASTEFQTMIRYQMAWVNADGSPYDKSAGKQVRPTLLLLCTEAAGGNWQDALPAAAAVEILHNFSLVHDDIQDKSEIRHGRETLWRVWDERQAINVGDAMFALSYCGMELLTEQAVPSPVSNKAWKIFNRTVLELTRGQNLDMTFEALPWVSVEDYLSMIRGKTAALLAACGEIGALIGAEDEALAQHYAEFGLNLGIAFQVHDDILGIWGDPAITGKSAASDIVLRKKSIPVLYALERSERLRAMYARTSEGDEDVQAIIHEIEATGARDYTIATEEQYSHAAIQALQRANPQGHAAEQLFALTDALLQREY